jgi:hypothetical protein
VRWYWWAVLIVLTLVGLFYMLAFIVTADRRREDMERARAREQERKRSG